LPVCQPACNPAASEAGGQMYSNKQTNHKNSFLIFVQNTIFHKEEADILLLALTMHARK